MPRSCVRGCARSLREALAPRSSACAHLRPVYSERTPFPEEGGAWEMEMNAQATKLQAVENDLKQLMADVTRAMEKAQEAVARIASKAAIATFGARSIRRSASIRSFDPPRRKR